MNNKIKIYSFTDLLVWQKGHQLVLDIYKITKNFPKDELFSLTNQIRRCAISITSNIAEGFGRFSPKEKVQFYFISLGSLTELQNQIIISKDVSYIDSIQYNVLIDKIIEIKKMLSGLIKTTRQYEK